MDNITPILDFLREQVAEAREQQRGEQPEALSDQDLALQAWQQEIEQYEALRLDRDLAIRLGEGHELHQDQPDMPHQLFLPGLVLIFPVIKANSNQPSSHVIPDGVRVQCISCTENFAIANTIRAQCSHNYCGTCAAKLFNSALIDETLFPPRCCRVPIPISTVRHLVGDDFVNRFHEKCLERTDPKSTYCSNPACSKYILSYLVMLNVVTCQSCLQKTCSLCKRPSHVGECLNVDEEALRLGVTKGWQRCYRCRTLVELNTGCNHITCRCGAEFCYVCSAVWQTCDCELWDEERLVDQAQELTNRDRLPGQQPAGQAQVQQMVQRVRERHECEHDGQWKRVGGRHRCQECRHLLLFYIHECEYCLLRACGECRYNRL